MRTLLVIADTKRDLLTFTQDVPEMFQGKRATFGNGKNAISYQSASRKDVTLVAIEQHQWNSGLREFVHAIMKEHWEGASQPGSVARERARIRIAGHMDGCFQPRETERLRYEVRMPAAEKDVADALAALGYDPDVAIVGFRHEQGQTLWSALIYLPERLHTDTPDDEWQRFLDQLVAKFDENPAEQVTDRERVSVLCHRLINLIAPIKGSLELGLMSLERPAQLGTGHGPRTGAAGHFAEARKETPEAMQQAHSLVSDFKAGLRGVGPHDQRVTWLDALTVALKEAADFMKEHGEGKDQAARFFEWHGRLRHAMQKLRDSVTPPARSAPVK